MFILTWFTVFLLYLSIYSVGSNCPGGVTVNKCNCKEKTFSIAISSTEASSTETSSTAASSIETLSTGKTTVETTSADTFFNEINVTESLIPEKLANATGPTNLICPRENEGISISDLESELSKFRNSMIYKLTLNKVIKETSKERSLKFPSSLFQGIRIKEIEITKTRLSPGFISTGAPFDNQRILTKLSAQECDLTGPLTYDSCGTVLTKNLEKATKLETLDLSNNYITCVASTAFINPPKNLKIINLSTNDISYIFPGAFKKVSRLQSIDLSHNCIQFQPKDIFPSPADYLVTINLENNAIKALPEDFFSNMPVLENVNLKNNYLHSLPEKVWSGIWSQLSSLNVDGHVFECSCDLVWMVKRKVKAGAEVTGTCTNYDDFGVHNLKGLRESQLACSD